MYTDDDGVVVIRGRLPQEVAALVQKGLEAAMDALKEEEKEKTRERVHAGGVRVEGQAPHRLVFHRPDGSVLVACPVRVPINGKAGETL
jgi:putative heme iron utilization protein